MSSSFSTSARDAIGTSGGIMASIQTQSLPNNNNNNNDNNNNNMTVHPKQKEAPAATNRIVWTQPRNFDVLCGRGNGINDHEGNFTFRKLVLSQKIRYVQSSKKDKPAIAQYIVQTMKSTYGSRFLARVLGSAPSTLTPHSNDNNNKDKKEDDDRHDQQELGEKFEKWYEISDKHALDKTRQALREGAPVIEKHLKKQQNQVQEEAKEKVQADDEDSKGGYKHAKRPWQHLLPREIETQILETEFGPSSSSSAFLPAAPLPQPKQQQGQDQGQHEPSSRGDNNNSNKKLKTSEQQQAQPHIPLERPPLVVVGGGDAERSPTTMILTRVSSMDRLQQESYLQEPPQLPAYPREYVVALPQQPQHRTRLTSPQQLPREPLKHSSSSNSADDAMVWNTKVAMTTSNGPRHPSAYLDRSALLEPQLPSRTQHLPQYPVPVPPVPLDNHQQAQPVYYYVNEEPQVYPAGLAPQVILVTPPAPLSSYRNGQQLQPQQCPQIMFATDPQQHPAAQSRQSVCSGGTYYWQDLHPQLAQPYHSTTVFLVPSTAVATPTILSSSSAAAASAGVMVPQCHHQQQQQLSNYYDAGGQQRPQPLHQAQHLGGQILWTTTAPPQPPPLPPASSYYYRPVVLPAGQEYSAARAEGDVPEGESSQGGGGVSSSVMSRCPLPPAAAAAPQHTVEYHPPMPQPPMPHYL